MFEISHAQRWIWRFFLAVSIGGDSDTIAAITGSIAEAFYGVPEHLKSAVLDYLPDEFIKVLSNFDNNK